MIGKVIHLINLKDIRSSSSFVFSFTVWHSLFSRPGNEVEPVDLLLGQRPYFQLLVKVVTWQRQWRRWCVLFLNSNSLSLLFCFCFFRSFFCFVFGPKKYTSIYEHVATALTISNNVTYETINGISAQMRFANCWK